MIFNSLAHSEIFEQEISPVLQKATDVKSRSLLMAGAGVFYVTHPYDDNIRDQWVQHQQMSVDTARVGERYISYGINISIAAAQLFWDFEEGKSHAKALIFTGITTLGLKNTTHRERPNQANHHSFPSGHTSSAFATATSLAYSYGWKAGLPAYAMATWTGLSRIADDDHWASDVVAGAFVGVIWGRACARGGAPEQQVQESWMALPVLTHEYGGVFIQHEY